MTTASQIISQASAHLHGWGTTQDRVAVLSADIQIDETQSFQVEQTFGQAIGISPGFVEIDTELLYVTTVNADTGTCTLAAGFGRGFNGTAAAAHLAGAEVITRPKFPKFRIFETINEIIVSLYPDLFATDIATFTVTFPLYRYALPEAAEWILSVQWQDPIGNWIPINAYTYDPIDGTMVLGDGPMIGRPLRVLYAKKPAKFTSLTDDLSVTGLDEGLVDLLQLGAAARMVAGLDISRAQLNTIEQSDRSRTIPPNQGINASKYLTDLYNNRLDAAKREIRRKYKARLRRVI